MLSALVPASPVKLPRRSAYWARLRSQQGRAHSWRAPQSRCCAASSLKPVEHAFTGLLETRELIPWPPARGRREILLAPLRACRAYGPRAYPFAITRGATRGQDSANGEPSDPKQRDLPISSYGLSDTAETKCRPPVRTDSGKAREGLSRLNRDIALQPAAGPTSASAVVARAGVALASSSYGSSNIPHAARRCCVRPASRARSGPHGRDARPYCRRSGLLNAGSHRFSRGGGGSNEVESES